MINDPDANPELEVSLDTSINKFWISEIGVSGSDPVKLETSDLSSSIRLHSPRIDSNCFSRVG